MTVKPPAKTLLVLSQVYVPDPASVGQHMADTAAEMARRGYRVVVLTARRGYEDPTRRYARREMIDGVEVRRLPLSSFGKSRLGLRFAAAMLFVLQCAVRGLFVRRLSRILVSTSPPMCPLAALVISTFRRVRVKYWCMDLNIDLLVVMGQAKETDFMVRLFKWMDRAILRRSSSVIALDKFMAHRLKAKYDVEGKMVVLAPWPHENHLEPVAHGDNPFRREQALQEKFVIMYSGNLGVGAPVDTVLEAALRFQDNPRLLLMFIGGGAGKKKITEFIERHQPNNIRLLPYQPLSKLKYSLSAADVHVVSVGDVVVGLSHPCKVYGAMAVGRPILLLGPPQCHVADILQRHDVGWHVTHGDVDSAVRTIQQMLDLPRGELATLGDQARRVVKQHFSMPLLRGQFCDTLADSAGKT